MATQLALVGLTGSLREGSANRGVLRAARDLLPADARLEILALDTLPFYNMDLEADEPASVRRFKEQLRRADAVLIATPEFNGSIPGVLKNALDWASRPFGQSVLAGKPTAITGAGVVGAPLALRSTCARSSRALAWRSWRRLKSTSPTVGKSLLPTASCKMRRLVTTCASW